MVNPEPDADPVAPLEDTVGRVLDALPDPAVVLDVAVEDPAVDWTVVRVNRAVAGVLGYPADGPGAVMLTALSATPDRGERGPLLAAMRRQQPLSYVRTVHRRDGSTFRATVSLTRLGDGEGSRQRWLLTVRDASHELAATALADERSAVEVRARQALRLVAKVSDILADPTSVRTLSDIAQLLVRRAVSWAGFFAADRAVQPITDLSGLPSAMRAQPSRGAGTGDPVRNLLDETRMRTIVIDRDSAADDTFTAQLLDLVAADPEAPPDTPVRLVPVLGRESVLGLLAVTPVDEAAASPHAEPGAVSAMTDAELITLLELVARRVGMAMDNLQLYDREHQLAETLQRAMLPEQRAVEGVDVWSYYSPNSAHAQVGGDWYDVLDLGEGQVAVVVGDVVGHDVEAAAAMGQLRSVVRAYAAEFLDPGTVLGRVDRLVAGMRIARPASFVYTVLSPQVDGGWFVAYSRAGHLPPMLVRDGEVSQLDGAGGMLVGFGEQPRHTAHTVAQPGDVLLFYTDGLVERRDRTMRDGVAFLAEVAGGIVAQDAAGVGEEVLLRLADDPQDDIAVVVLRIPDAKNPASTWASPRQRRWQMPMDPQTIPRARQVVLRACEAWGIEDTATIELVVSELVTNAVMHGWGRVDLRLQVTGDGLRIEVEDANPAPPVQREGHTGRVGGFGMHIIARLAEWGWRPTPAGKVVWARVREQRPWSVEEGAG